MPITTVPRRPRRSGFTLVELLISTSLCAIILAAVLSTVLMISRSGYLLNNYIDMEKQARHALETFAVDARITKEVEWTRASQNAPLTGITLITPDAARVTYTYNSGAGTLVRTDSTGTMTLISGIQSLSFTAYKYNDTTGLAAIVPASVALVDSIEAETKMVQISLSAIRTRSTLADATNTVVSARFVLRNKIITN